MKIERRNREKRIKDQRLKKNTKSKTIMEEVIKTKSKYVRMTPRKIRLITDMVKGMNALEAVETLKFVNKAAALPVRKAIETAIADAENNFDKDTEKLVIVEARADEAPMLKRGRAVSRGRYHRILKRSSHIIIGVRESIN